MYVLLADQYSVILTGILFPDLDRQVAVPPATDPPELNT
jgi:hypothetical protein